MAEGTRPYRGVAAQYAELPYCIVSFPDLSGFTLPVSTYHGMSHKEAREIRVLTLHVLHVLDHILSIGVEVLYMCWQTLTPTMAN